MTGKPPLMHEDQELQQPIADECIFWLFLPKFVLGVQHHASALQLRPPGNPLRSSLLDHLASTMETLLKHELSHDSHSTIDGDDEDSSLVKLALYREETLGRIVETLREASNDQISTVAALRAGLHWVDIAREFHHDTILEAFRATFTCIDHLVVTASSVSQRHKALQDARVPRTLSADAAACAIGLNDYQAAIELLEQGRAFIWNQQARIRTPVDELREVDTSLASRLDALRDQISQHSVLPRQLAEASNSTQSWASQEAAAKQYRDLACEWDRLVDEIRAVDGFVHFLRPIPFHVLQEASRDGPVIVVNASKLEDSCNALVVAPRGAPVHVPLSALSFKAAMELSAVFREIMKRNGAEGEESARDAGLTDLLRQVWNYVVEPITKALSHRDLRFAFPDSKNPRVWWCPTSVFTSLPLHSAGPYSQGGRNFSARFISSYTPTLSALIRSRKQWRHAALDSPKLLVLGQSKPHDGTEEKTLRTVGQELQLVKELVSPALPTSILSEDAATANAVLAALREHSLVHIACHGRQDMLRPYNSSFAMHDMPLSLLDIINNDLGKPEFAFLSACHTAVGDKSMPDEVIHLAAGMQFAGFKSVIGSLWTVDDEAVHYMVTAFYSNFRTLGMDPRNAAIVLNRATREVVQKKLPVPLDQRIVFIHIGV